MWKEFKLGDICSFQNGRAFKKSEWSEIGLPIIRIQNLRENPTEFNFYKGHFEKNILIQKGDLLLSWSGTIKPFIWNQGPALLNQHVFKVSTSESIEKKFAFYFLQNFISEISKQKVGIGLQHITKKTFQNFKIFLPSIFEQKLIVEKLDNAFAEIDKGLKFKQEQIEENKKFFKSFLDSCFNESFLTMKIGDLGQVSSGGTPSSKNPDYWKGDIQWYSSGELNNKFAEKSLKRITKEGLSNSNAKVFPKGSLLVGMYDTAAMKMSILREESTFNQAIVGIAPNKSVSIEYLYFALNYLKDSILQQRRGVRQQNLSLAKIKNIEIPVPNMDIQQSIVKRLNLITNQNNVYQRYLFSTIENFLALKSALLSKEISGDLR